MRTHRLSVVRMLYLGAITFGTISNALAVTVVNPSFENTILAPNTFQGDGIGNDGPGGPQYVVGWSGPGDSGAQNFGNLNYFVPADGVNVAYVVGPYIYQDVGLLKSNTTYSLTVAAGNQANYGVGSTGAIVLANGPNLLSTLLASNTVSSLNVGSMSDFTVNYHTGSLTSGDLVIGLKNFGAQVLYDNVRLSAVTAIPEPGAIAFLGLGSLGILAIARRRK